MPRKPPRRSPRDRLQRWSPAAIREALDNRDTDPRPFADLARDIWNAVKALVARELYPRAAQQDRDPRQLRDDLTQDIVMKAFQDDGRELRTWQPERGWTLYGFLRWICRCKVIQTFRTGRGNPWRNPPHAPETLDGLNVQEPDLEELLHLGELRKLLTEDLPLEKKRLYFALFVHHRPAEEVAREFNMTRDAVYQWAARFRRRAAQLANELEERDQGGTSSNSNADDEEPDEGKSDE